MESREKMYHDFQKFAQTIHGGYKEISQETGIAYAYIKLVMSGHSVGSKDCYLKIAKFLKDKNVKQIGELNNFIRKYSNDN